MEKPLTGVRVVDLTHWWSGPEGTGVLAALGADVIKVEAVQRPDSSRALQAQDLETDPYWFERSSTFNGANASKRGITLDLTRKAGLDIFKRLVAKSDVVINNFSARVMVGLGLSHAQLEEINPAIVTVDMTSFGLTGSWRDLVGFAYVFEQMSGAAAVTGYEDGPPSTLGGASDPSAGYLGALAVLLGLCARDLTGRSQHFDISQTEAMAAFLGPQMIEAQLSGEVPKRHGNRHPTWAPHNVYRCSGEDEWVAVAIRTDEEWARFVEILGRPAWATDQQLERAEGRKAHERLIDRHVEAWTSTQDKAVAAATLWAAGIPSGELLMGLELEDDLQLQARQVFQPFLREPVGEIALPVIPLRLSGVDVRHTRPAPRLGEHSEEVLKEILHLSDDEISALEADTIIGKSIPGAGS
jgi:crotonobetainyl-CoA:carnitine CoA-transferase CaiB-like acyl-CoA transferase